MHAHSQSSIWLIKKWEGREGEFAWIFLTDKFHKHNRIFENMQRRFSIYYSLGLIAEPGNFRKNEHKHI
jgi:hypothetical protein